MNFEVGIYYYKNLDNDNGMVINVIKTTKKTMVYNIGKYCDWEVEQGAGELDEDTIRKKNTREKIILHSTTYRPQDATGYFDNENMFYWSNLPSN